MEIKTHVIMYAMVYEVDENTTIETLRIGNEQSFYARNHHYYTKERDVDRLLCILNSDNYRKVIKRGGVTGCLFITCYRR